MMLQGLTTIEDVVLARRELKDLKDSFYLKRGKSNYCGDYQMIDKNLFKSPEEIDVAAGELENLPQVRTTLAFYPSALFAREIAKKIRNAFGPNVVLDLKVDSSLIGGLTISYRGQYLDLSLRKKIDAI